MKKKTIMMLICSLLSFCTIQVHAETHDESPSESLSDDLPLITDTLTELFENTSQNNKMLDIAWQDYQQIEDYTFLDIMSQESDQVTTLTEIEEHFESSTDEVEIYIERAETGLQLLSYTYKAEDGDLNPERMIEDWAQIEFYFIDEKLIYSGVATMSLEFSESNALAAEDFDPLLYNQESPSALANYHHFELQGLGQMYSNGSFYYGLAFPINHPEIDNQIGAFVVASVVNDQLDLTTVSSAEEAFAFSYTSVIFSSLATIVPNNLFMEQEAMNVSL